MARTIILTIIALIIAPLISPGAPVEEKIGIVTTIFPVYDFARSIAGDSADVTLLLPPAQDAHHFEPRPSDIRLVARADLFIYCLKELEVWAEKILNGIGPGKLRVLEAGQGLARETGSQRHSGDHDRHGHPRIDPHVWLDLELSTKMADRILAALIAVKPENEKIYRLNHARLAKKLQDLDKAFRDLLGNCPRRTIYFSGHQAFGYLASRYSLDFRAIYGISPDSEPSAGAIAGFISRIRKEKIAVLFYEELFHPRVAETIVAATGVRLLPLTPCHNVSRDEFRRGVSFTELMAKNLENILRGLECYGKNN